MIQLIIGLILASILGPLLGIWVNKIRGATGPHILPRLSEIEPLQEEKNHHDIHSKASTQRSKES